jgi:hypothetical protein
MRPADAPLTRDRIVATAEEVLLSSVLQSKYAGAYSAEYIGPQRDA